MAVLHFPASRFDPKILWIYGHLAARAAFDTWIYRLRIVEDDDKKCRDACSWIIALIERITKQADVTRLSVSLGQDVYGSVVNKDLTLKDKFKDCIHYIFIINVIVS